MNPNECLEFRLSGMHIGREEKKLELGASMTANFFLSYLSPSDRMCLWR